MRSSDSGQAHGTNGSPQMNMEQSQSSEKAKQNEDLAAQNASKAYDLRTLPKSSPMHIPGNAAVIEQQKDGYQQVKYQWTRGKYKYLNRWHQRTPNAPATRGNSWVIERTKPGIARGPNVRPAEHEVYIKGENGKGHWVSKSRWYAAIAARKRGTATKKQEELLNNGHWPAP